MSLASTIFTPQDIPKTLNKLVKKIQKIMESDSCSLFMYDPDDVRLILKATTGLNSKMIDLLSMSVGEGLTGKTLQFLKPISVSNVSKNKDYKLISGLGDDQYQSYLSIPLVYGQNPIGVLIIQKIEKIRYKKSQIEKFLSLAVPTVHVLERSKFIGALGDVSEKKKKRKKDTVIEFVLDHHIRGIAASPGIGIGKIQVLKPHYGNRRKPKGRKGISSEKQRLKKAFQEVSKEIRETRKAAEERFGPDELDIFDAYLLFLKSERFKGEIFHLIEDGESAVSALNVVAKRYIDRISNSDDEYIRERAYDIQDVTRKLQDFLTYGTSKQKQLSDIKEKSVFYAEHWSISDFVQLNPKYVEGIVSAHGGASSHIAVLADAIGIPAVLGISDFSPQEFEKSSVVIVDGYSGSIIVNPSDDTLSIHENEKKYFKKQKKQFEKDKAKRVYIKNEESRSLFQVGANVEVIGHVGLALDAGADEIGLYRTEFPYLIGNHLPTEEEQYQLYSRVLKMMKGREVTFRTLDIGGDKYLSYLDLPKEDNPFLGWRSIRFSLARKDLFRIQLRALLRASIFGKMRILFPMISSMDEVYDVVSSVEAVEKELYDEGLRLLNKIPLGFMIEVPAAVEIIDLLSKYASFFSIGTNDLIQYTLAVDRTNPHVAKFYDPFHPAVIKMLSRAIKGAKKRDIKITSCGDLSTKPLLLMVLLGLGIDGISVNPSSIPKMKYLLRALDANKLQKLMKKVLKCETGRQVQHLLAGFAEEHSLTEFFIRNL